MTTNTIFEWLNNKSRQEFGVDADVMGREWGKQALHSTKEVAGSAGIWPAEMAMSMWSTPGQADVANIQRMYGGDKEGFQRVLRQAGFQDGYTSPSLSTATDYWSQPAPDADINALAQMTPKGGVIMGTANAAGDIAGGALAGGLGWLGGKAVDAARRVPWGQYGRDMRDWFRGHSGHLEHNMPDGYLGYTPEPPLPPKFVGGRRTEHPRRLRDDSTPLALPPPSRPQGPRTPNTDGRERPFQPIIDVTPERPPVNDGYKSPTRFNEPPLPEPTPFDGPPISPDRGGWKEYEEVAETVYQRPQLPEGYYHLMYPDYDLFMSGGKPNYVIPGGHAPNHEIDQLINEIFYNQPRAANPRNRPWFEVGREQRDIERKRHGKEIWLGEKREGRNISPQKKRLKDRQARRAKEKLYAPRKPAPLQSRISPAARWRGHPSPSCLTTSPVGRWQSQSRIQGLIRGHQSMWMMTLGELGNLIVTTLPSRWRRPPRRCSPGSRNRVRRHWTRACTRMCSCPASMTIAPVGSSPTNTRPRKSGWNRQWCSSRSTIPTCPRIVSRKWPWCSLRTMSLMWDARVRKPAASAQEHARTAALLMAGQVDIEALKRDAWQRRQNQSRSGAALPARARPRTGEKASYLKELGRTGMRASMMGPAQSAMLPAYLMSSAAEMGMNWYDTGDRDWIQDFEDGDWAGENATDAEKEAHVQRVFALMGRRPYRDFLINRHGPVMGEVRFNNATEREIANWMKGYKSHVEVSVSPKSNIMQDTTDAVHGAMEAIGVNPTSSAEALGQFAPWQRNLMAGVDMGTQILTGGGALGAIGKGATAARKGFNSWRSGGAAPSAAQQAAAKGKEVLNNSGSAMRKGAFMYGAPLAGAGIGAATTPDQGDPVAHYNSAVDRAGTGALIGGAAQLGAQALNWGAGKLLNASPTKMAFDKLIRKDENFKVDASMQRTVDNLREDWKRVFPSDTKNTGIPALASLGSGDPYSRIRQMMNDYLAYMPEGLTKIGYRAMELGQKVNKAERGEVMKADRAARKAAKEIEEYITEKLAPGTPGRTRIDNAERVSDALHNQSTAERAKLSARYDALEEEAGDTTFSLLENVKKPTTTIKVPQGKGQTPRKEEVISDEALEDINKFLNVDESDLRLSSLEPNALEELAENVVKFVTRTKDKWTTREGIALVRKINLIQRYADRMDGSIVGNIKRIKRNIYERLGKNMPEEQFKKFTQLQEDYQEYARTYARTNLMREATGQKTKPHEFAADDVVGRVIGADGKINTSGYQWMQRALQNEKGGVDMINKMVLDEAAHRLDVELPVAAYNRLSRHVANQLRAAGKDNPGYTKLATDYQNMLDERVFAFVASKSGKKLYNTIADMEERDFSGLLRGAKRVGAKQNKVMVGNLADKVLDSIAKSPYGKRELMILEVAPKLNRLGVPKHKTQLWESISRLRAVFGDERFLKIEPEATGIPKVAQRIMQYVENVTGTKLRSFWSMMRMHMVRIQNWTTTMVGSLVPNIARNSIGRQVLDWMLDESMKKDPTKFERVRKIMEAVNNGDQEAFRKWMPNIAANLADEASLSHEEKDVRLEFIAGREK